MTTPILEAKELTQKFGGLTAVDNVSLHVGVDELVALIGPNGAGKTTLFNMLTGVNAPTEGDVYLAGEKITGKKAYAVAQMGISRTFQNIRLFSDMTVLENVLTALTNHYKENFVSSVLRLPGYYKTEAAMKEEAMKLLNDFGLASVAENRAGNLPYGAQRRVEIVRALATRPKVIFLDEPAAGMNPEETADLTRLIKKIQSEYHTAVLLIEHDMSLVMNIAERIYVLDHGHLLAEGTPKEFRIILKLSKLTWEVTLMPMLEVKNLSVNYGAIQAVRNVSFQINKGEIVTLIGANGAGKSTIVKTISGILKPKSGELVYEGTHLEKLKPNKVVAKGISQVPEGRHVFEEMTVRENLLMGAYLRNDRDGIQEDFEKMYQRFPVLKEREKQDAATLSGGEQQMLVMARALMARPKLILLDEPSMGLSPIYIQEVFKIIETIRDQGTTVLLIEQNAKQALSIADRGYVLASGEVKMTGTGKDLLDDPSVQKAYLGG